MEECLLREIKEETSPDVKTLRPKALTDFVIEANEDFDKDRRFYLYEAAIPDLDFEVYEGDGAEAFKLEDLKKRDDLTGSAKYTFSNVL